MLSTTSSPFPKARRRHVGSCHSNAHDAASPTCSCNDDGPGLMTNNDVDGDRNVDHDGQRKGSQHRNGTNEECTTTSSSSPLARTVSPSQPSTRNATSGGSPMKQWSITALEALFGRQQQKHNSPDRRIRTLKTLAHHHHHQQQIQSQPQQRTDRPTRFLWILPRFCLMCVVLWPVTTILIALWKLDEQKRPALPLQPSTTVATLQRLRRFGRSSHYAGGQQYVSLWRTTTLQFLRKHVLRPTHLRLNSNRIRKQQRSKNHDATTTHHHHHHDHQHHQHADDSTSDGNDAMMAIIAEPEPEALSSHRAHTPNYAGLVLRLPNRVIRTEARNGKIVEYYVRGINVEEDLESYEYERDTLLTIMDNSITDYDYESLEPTRFEHFDDLLYNKNPDTGEYDHLKVDCFRPKWSYAIYPSCNNFHEVDVMFGVTHHGMKHLGHGAFRDSWMTLDVHGNEDIVLKANRLIDGRDFKIYDYSQTQMEAISMISTHSSNKTMNIYGHCGTSVQVEPGDDTIEDDIMRDYIFIKQETLDRYQDEDVRPRNKFTPEAKLELALAMAEGVAEIHGNRQGVIISHDLGLDQFLVSKKDGLYKLNDFNKARTLCWNEEKQQYGKVWSHQYYNFRAPEEIYGGWIDDGSDTLTIGNLFYCLLTGLQPFYHKPNHDAACDAIDNGEHPWIDPRYRTRSFIEGRLVKIMERMWRYNNDDRASIFEVVEFLRETERLAGIEARGHWR